MMVRFLTQLKPVNLKNKICLLRLDLNTEDNWRLLASLPTLKFLTANCRAVIILSHKGRPVGFEKKLSLRKYSVELKKLLGKIVIFIPHFRFEEIKNLVESSPQGSIFLLENLRFLKEEGDNNPVLAEHLASLGNFYVNEAFAVSHRANTSVVAVTEYLPSYAGFGLESEIKNLSKVMQKPAQPLVVVLGGLKIEDKLGIYHNLKKQASAFLIGGALDKNVLKLQLPKLVIPVDFKYEKGIIRDIGPKSVKLFQKHIKSAKTILWNGPLGNINKKRFEAGTRAIAKAIAANKEAFKVTGGGETVTYLKKLKLDKKFDFVSTGGGAMLEFLAGKKLPGLEALRSNRE
jgi:3-phosphoglycerate kinase